MRGYSIDSSECKVKPGSRGNNNDQIEKKLRHIVDEISLESPTIKKL